MSPSLFYEEHRYILYITETHIMVLQIYNEVPVSKNVKVL